MWQRKDTLKLVPGLILRPRVHVVVAIAHSARGRVSVRPFFVCGTVGRDRVSRSVVCG